MEPIPFGDILFEEKLIASSLHQLVCQESSRKIQAEKILEELRQTWEKKFDEAEEKWERLIFDMQRKQEMAGHKHKLQAFRPENPPFDNKNLENEFKAPDIEHCISQLKWIAVLEKLKDKGNNYFFKDCMSHSYTLSSKFISKCFTLL